MKMDKTEKQNTRVRYVKIEDYEYGVKHHKTGLRKTDYFKRVGIIKPKTILQLYGLYDVVFSDGQMWTFNPKQLKVLEE